MVYSSSLRDYLVPRMITPSLPMRRTPWRTPCRWAQWWAPLFKRPLALSPHTWQVVEPVNDFSALARLGIVCVELSVLWRTHSLSNSVMRALFPHVKDNLQGNVHRKMSTPFHPVDCTRISLLERVSTRDSRHLSRLPYTLDASCIPPSIGL